MEVAPGEDTRRDGEEGSPDKGASGQEAEVAGKDLGVAVAEDGRRRAMGEAEEDMAEEVDMVEGAAADMEEAIRAVAAVGTNTDKVNMEEVALLRKIVIMAPSSTSLIIRRYKLKNSKANCI